MMQKANHTSKVSLLKPNKIFKTLQVYKIKHLNSILRDKYVLQID
jgi:hypothetical protein